MSRHDSFLERHRDEYQKLCDDDLQRVYHTLERRKWPVDGLIDWFRSAGGGDPKGFCIFFRCLYEWAVLRDKTQLCLLVLIVGQKNFRRCDNHSYYDWLVEQLHAGGVNERFLSLVLPHR